MNEVLKSYVEAKNPILRDRVKKKKWCVAHEDKCTGNREKQMATDPWQRDACFWYVSIKSKLKPLLLRTNCKTDKNECSMNAQQHEYATRYEMPQTICHKNL